MSYLNAEYADLSPHEGFLMCRVWIRCREWKQEYYNRVCEIFQADMTYKDSY